MRGKLWEPRRLPVARPDDRLSENVHNLERKERKERKKSTNSFQKAFGCEDDYTTLKKKKLKLRTKSKI